jgi:hypothetical protein
MRMSIRAFHFDHPNQGDKIGRIFALQGECLLWAIYVPKLHKWPKSFGHFNKLKVTLQFWQNILLGNILGDFFTKSTGHPDPKAATMWKYLHCD